MGVSPRKILAIGLSLAGVDLPGRADPGPGPQGRPAHPADERRREREPAPGTFAPAVPTVVGTIDLDYVFKNYDKVKAANKELGAAIQVRKGELMKLENEGRQEVEMMQKLQPGSADYRKHENKATEIKAKMEAGKEQAEREITLRQAETMATLYKEVQAYAEWVAKQRGITHVMTVVQHAAHRERAELGPGRRQPPGDLRRPRATTSPNDVVYYLNQKLPEAWPARMPRPSRRHARSRAVRAPSVPAPPSGRRPVSRSIGAGASC